MYTPGRSGTPRNSGFSPAAKSTAWRSRSFVAITASITVDSDGHAGQKRTRLRHDRRHTELGPRAETGFEQRFGRARVAAGEVQLGVPLPRARNERRRRNPFLEGQGGTEVRVGCIEV